MKAFVKDINNELLSRNITQTQLAKVSGFSCAMVTSILKNEAKVRFPFLIKSMVLLGKDSHTKKKYRDEFIPYATNKDHREIMESLAMSGEFKPLRPIVDVMLSSTIKKNIEFAQVYDLILKRYEEGNDLQEIHKKLEALKSTVKTPEMKILIEILLCQSSYQAEDFSSFAAELSRIERDIKGLKDKFFKASFTVRIQEAFCATSLQANNLNVLRENGQKILEASETDDSYVLAKITALGKIGESLFFEDYERSKAYLEEAMLLLLKFNDMGGMNRKLKTFERNLNLLKIYHWKDLDGIEDDIEIYELVFLRLKEGKNAEALELLKEVEKKDGKLSPPMVFFKGWALNDNELVKISIQMYRESGSNFYIKLPQIYLGIL